MAIVLGIYDKLVHSVAAIFKDFRKTSSPCTVWDRGSGRRTHLQPPDGRRDDQVSLHHAVPYYGRHYGGIAAAL